MSSHLSSSSMEQGELEASPELSSPPFIQLDMADYDYKDTLTRQDSISRLTKLPRSPEEKLDDNMEDVLIIQPPPQPLKPSNSGKKEKRRHKQHKERSSNKNSDGKKSKTHQRLRSSSIHKLFSTINRGTNYPNNSYGLSGSSRHHDSHEEKAALTHKDRMQLQHQQSLEDRQNEIFRRNKSQSERERLEKLERERRRLENERQKQLLKIKEEKDQEKKKNRGHINMPDISNERKTGHISGNPKKEEEQRARRMAVGVEPLTSKRSTQGNKLKDRSVLKRINSAKDDPNSRFREDLNLRGFQKSNDGLNVRAEKRLMNDVRRRSDGRNTFKDQKKDNDEISSTSEETFQPSITLKKQSSNANGGPRHKKRREHRRNLLRSPKRKRETHNEKISIGPLEAIVSAEIVINSKENSENSDENSDTDVINPNEEINSGNDNTNNTNNNNNNSNNNNKNQLAYFKNTKNMGNNNREGNNGNGNNGENTVESPQEHETLVEEEEGDIEKLDDNINNPYVIVKSKFEDLSSSESSAENDNYSSNSTDKEGEVEEKSERQIMQEEDLEYDEERLRERLMAGRLGKHSRMYNDSSTGNFQNDDRNYFEKSNNKVIVSNKSPQSDRSASQGGGLSLKNGINSITNYNSSNNNTPKRGDNASRDANNFNQQRKKLPDYYPALQGCRNVEEFHCLNRIEEGTYGVVYRAVDVKTEEIVALKRLKMEKEKEGFPITSLREINTLLKAQHPNIVTVREIVVGSNMDKIYIVMDYVEHDLKSLMEYMKEPFIIGEVKTLLVQLLRGVAHLHDNWIVHRDLKTSNLLLSHKGILKIGDFGLAREYGSPLRPYTPIVVTLWYRAPELLLGVKQYSTPIDMWSVGCIFGEFLTRKPIFPGKSEIDELNKIFKDLGTPNEKIWPGVGELSGMKKCTFADYPYNQLRKRFEQHISEKGFDLMNKFLTYNPEKRISAEDAIHHEFFTESPLPVDPSMFPTWPAKSEQARSRTHGNSPKPPSGGKAYAKLLGDDDEISLGFTLNAGPSLNAPPKGGGFALKF